MPTTSFDKSSSSRYYNYEQSIFSLVQKSENI